MMLPVYVLRLLALASTAVALMIIVHVAASAPAGEGKRLGLRGLKRQRALQSTPFWSTLEPIVVVKIRCFFSPSARVHASGIIGSFFFPFTASSSFFMPTSTWPNTRTSTSTGGFAV